MTWARRTRDVGIGSSRGAATSSGCRAPSPDAQDTAAGRAGRDARRSSSATMCPSHQHCRDIIAKAVEKFGQG
jgi:hypothetical protein